MAEDKLEIINPPKGLKEKAGTGGPGIMDPKALEKGEEAIASLADSYLDSVVDDLRNIDEAFKKLEAATGDRKEELMGVFQTALILKGQGGSFGYDLMTTIGNELCRLIEKLDKAGPKEVEAIKLHIDSSPISQVNSIFDALRWRLCYKNQYVEVLMEWLAWHTRWVNRNGTDFGSILTAA